jgi:TRAP-type C4-dicarboxylate transport system substrate-binding protein
MIIVNKAAFDGLDAGTRDAVTKAGKEAEDRGWKLAQEKTKWYTDQLAAKGMKVLPPSAELKSGFQKIGEQLTADWLKKAGPEGQAVVDAYKKAGT